MSAPTTTRSAYPPDVEDLMPAARELAIRLDRVPSLNELRTDLRIGYDKARPIREQLEEQAREYDEAAARAAALDQSDLEELEEVEQRPEPQPTTVAEALQTAPPKASVWPIVILALPAFVAIWSGWVGLGGLTGFGPVHLLPGIADDFSINSAITLPVGMETYAAYALRVWLGTGLPEPARKFAKWSSIGSLTLGALGQVAYHLMVAAGYRSAPWPITILVSCLPVAVLGMGAALAHLVRRTGPDGK